MCQNGQRYWVDCWMMVFVARISSPGPCLYVTATVAQDLSLPVSPYIGGKWLLVPYNVLTLLMQDLAGCATWIPKVCPKMCFSLAVKLCLGLRNILWYCVSVQTGDYTAVNGYFPLLSSFSSFIWINCCLLNWKPAWNVPRFLIGMVQKEWRKRWGPENREHNRLWDGVFFLCVVKRHVNIF